MICLNDHTVIKLIKINFASYCLHVFVPINWNVLHIGSFACFVQFSKVYIVVLATFISYQFLHIKSIRNYCCFDYKLIIKRMATSYSHKGKPLTTIGAKKLNFCVRHGNRCVLLAIATTLWWVIHSKLDWSHSSKLIEFFSFYWLSPRSISISPLQPSLAFHFWPIYLIISQGSYFLKEMGNLILRWASHLDAFSVYPFPT